ncbi:MAG: DUF2490 domain-containing protein [Bacteroidota bacterium]
MNRLIAAFLLFAGSLTARAQENDFGMWNTLNLEYKLSQNFSIVACEEFRLKENLSQVNLFYTNIGFSYRINKNFKVSPIYRFIQKRFDDGYYGLKHRLMLDLGYKQKLGMIRFGYRARLQGEIAYPGADRLGDVAEYYWRNKFDFKLDINSSRFVPYFGTELRVQLFNPRIREHQEFGFDRTRLYAGCDYEINDGNTFGLYYLVQFDFQQNDPVTQYILGLEYSLTLFGGGGDSDNGDNKINE